jgi:hypothetical protein
MQCAGAAATAATALLAMIWTPWQGADDLQSCAHWGATMGRTESALPCACQCEKAGSGSSTASPPTQASFMTVGAGRSTCKSAAGTKSRSTVHHGCPG